MWVAQAWRSACGLNGGNPFATATRFTIRPTERTSKRSADCLCPTGNNSASWGTLTRGEGIVSTRQDARTMVPFSKPKRKFRLGGPMKRMLAIALFCTAVALIASAQAGNVPKDLQQTLISLDKEWGNSGADAAKLDKIIGDNLIAVSTKGEAQDKKQLVADNVATSAGVMNASYVADEYKFEMLSPDVVVMTHRGTTKGMQNGKEVTESHRSLHVFQKRDGRWQVVANAQVPIGK